MGKGRRVLLGLLSKLRSAELLVGELAGRQSTTDWQSGLRRQGALPDRSGSLRCGPPPELLVLVSWMFSVRSPGKYKALANLGQAIAYSTCG